ncbi:hypothetical protein ACU4GR_13575 [Methylobacterium oryzae CBMB20]
MYGASLVIIVRVAGLCTHHRRRYGRAAGGLLELMTGDAVRQHDKADQQPGQQGDTSKD